MRLSNRVVDRLSFSSPMLIMFACGAVFACAVRDESWLKGLNCLLLLFTGIIATSHAVDKLVDKVISFFVTKEVCEKQ